MRENIYEADFGFPIILAPSGVVLDGMHRLCKAFLQGVEEIDAVQLPTMPSYRWRLLPSGEEVEFAAKTFEQITVAERQVREFKPRKTPEPGASASGLPLKL